MGRENAGDGSGELTGQEGARSRKRTQSWNQEATVKAAGAGCAWEIRGDPASRRCCWPHLPLMWLGRAVDRESQQSTRAALGPTHGKRGSGDWLLTAVSEPKKKLPKRTHPPKCQGSQTPPEITHSSWAPSFKVVRGVGSKTTQRWCGGKIPQKLLGLPMWLNWDVAGI